MSKCFYCRKEEPVLISEKISTGTVRDSCPECFEFITGFNTDRLHSLRLHPPTRQKPRLMIIKNNGGNSDSRN